MPRIPEYDADDALDRALHHFWQRGYLDTTIEELVDATGVQRYGLYQTFGNKHGLFLSALRRYQEVYITHRLRDLETDNAGLDEIKSVINGLAIFADSPLGRFGCLLCNTAVELGARDEAIDAEVNRYANRLRDAFEKAVSSAQNDGEIDPSADTDSLSDYLAGVIVGACVYARTQARPGAVRAMLETTLDRLPVIS